MPGGGAEQRGVQGGHDAALGGDVALEVAARRRRPRAPGWRRPPGRPAPSGGAAAPPAPAPPGPPARRSRPGASRAARPAGSGRPACPWWRRRESWARSPGQQPGCQPARRCDRQTRRGLPGWSRPAEVDRCPGRAGHASARAASSPSRSCEQDRGPHLVQACLKRPSRASHPSPFESHRSPLRRCCRLKATPIPASRPRTTHPPSRRASGHGSPPRTRPSTPPSRRRP